MGDLRNKIMKRQRAEADKRGMAALLASLGSSPPSPSPKGSLSLKCEGCGLDAKDQCNPDGTFTRLFSVAGGPMVEGEQVLLRILHRAAHRD